MLSSRASTIRTFAAWLVCASGVAYLASPWFRPLDAAAVMAIVLGATYLIVGLGLFGQSRFTLFVATALCAVNILMSLQALPEPLTPTTQLAIATDTTAMLCCIAVLILRWEQTPD